MRLVLDQSVRWRARTLTGGTPRRVVRLTAAGSETLQRLERGNGSSPAAQALGRRLLDAGLAHPRPRPRPRPREASDEVTVVIPVRDRPEELGRCLAALGREVKVIVVDDGSRDRGPLAGVVARAGARLVRRETAGGPAAARNAALGLLSTELVAFLDSDCVAPRGWLQALVGHFDDPLVGAVAPRVRPVSRVGASALERYVAARSPLDMGGREASVEPGGRVTYVPAAALLVRRRALDGGFDADLRYGEDVDLVWRLRDAGWRVRYDPSVAVAHREPSRPRRIIARRFRYGTSAAPLARRHPGRLSPATFRPWPAAAAVLLLSRRPRVAAVICVQQSAILSQRIGRLGLPPIWAARWFAEALYGQILSMARYGATFAWPCALAYAWRTRRPAVLALLAVPAADEWRLTRPSLDPFRWIALTLVDDAAYGAGVWWGAVRTRDLRPLIPTIPASVRSSGPRRSAARDR